MSTGPEARRQFELHIDIDATPDAVWEAIASSEGLRRWFATEAEVTPGVGGKVVWTWQEFHSWPQVIEVWEPGKRLRTRYDSSVDDGAGGVKPLFVEFELRGEGGRTTLRLVHSGFGPEASFDQEYDGISHGWPIELSSLKLYLEQHPGRDRVVAWRVCPLNIEADEAWQRLTGPEGLACGRDIDQLKPKEAFAFNTPSGDTFEGQAGTCDERAFSGIDRRGGGSFLRIGIENCGGSLQAWLWCASYGVDAAEMKQLEDRWQTMLGRLFPQEATAPTSGQ